MNLAANAGPALANAGARPVGTEAFTMIGEVTEQTPTLRRTSRFTAEPQEGHHAWRSLLFLDGQPTGRLAPGVRVVAQFSYGDRWLILLDEDNTLAGYLHILLLSPSLSMIDHRELGLLWAIPSFVGRLEIVAPNAIEFDFFGGGDRWRLTLLSVPRFMWVDWNRPETRQWRRILSRRWMALDQVSSDLTRTKEAGVSNRNGRPQHPS